MGKIKILLFLILGFYLFAQKEYFAPGTLKWKYKPGDWRMSSPAIGLDGTIYFGSFDNYLYALSSDGKLKWRYKTGEEVGFPPAIV